MFIIFLYNDASTKIKCSNINITLSTDISLKRFHGVFSTDKISTNINLIVLAIKVNDMLPGGTVLVWEQLYYTSALNPGGYIRIESIQAYTDSNRNGIDIPLIIAYIDL